MNPPTDVTRTFTEDMLHLENICLVSVAAKIWDMPFFKREMASYYRRSSEIYTQADEKNSQTKHCELEQRILYKLKDLPMPKSLMEKLEEVVLFIGCKFSEHIHYVTGSLKLDISYVDEVYWTPYGTIDRSKIYESWKRKSNFIKADIFPANWKGIPLIYFMAAIYTDEEFIGENQNSIIESIESSRLEIKIGREHNTIYNIISVLIYLYQFCKVPIKYLGEAYVHIPAVDMFQVCYKANYITATDYFWKILKENGNVLSELVDIPNNFVTGESFYFLIRKMSLEERNIFLMKNMVYLTRRITHDWPFSKFLLTIWDSDLVLPEQYFWLFTHALTRAVGFKFVFPVKNKLVVNSLNKLWSKLSVIDKLIVIKVKTFDSDCEETDRALLSSVNWYDLMYRSHFQCLRVIINDKDLQRHRSVMDAALVKILLYWVDRNEPEGRKQISIFLNEALISDDDRKKMENELNLAVRKKYSLPSTVNYTDIQGRSTLYKLGGFFF